MQNRKIMYYEYRSLNSLDGEQWVAIPDFPNYEISNLGRVKSVERKHYTHGFETRSNHFRNMKAKILKQAIMKDGYLKCTLYNNKVRMGVSVHRLVAEAFIKNPLHKIEVHHRYGIKTDNRMTELEWVTHLENQKYANLNGRKYARGENHPSSRLKNKDVTAIRNKYKKGVSIKKLGEMFNYTYGGIWRIIKRHSFANIR